MAASHLHDLRAARLPGRRAGSVQPHRVLGGARGRRPMSSVDPWVGCAVDWDATIAYRSRLWDLGLGVAEAMDTAQRGMGLDWPTSLELIRRSIDASRSHRGALVFSGCGTDHLVPGERTTVADVITAYEQQADAIEGLGGRLIVMASRALAACARARPTSTASSTTAAVAGPAAGDHPLARRHVRPRPEGLLGHRRPRRGDGRRGRRDQPQRGEGRTASRCRCSTRTARSRCAAGSRRACGCTPATTSTSPS